MPRYVLSLGSSNQNGPEQLNKCVKRLAALDKRLTVIAQSPAYQNMSVGMRYPRSCFNSCIAITTTLSPEELFFKIKRIETTMGRIRTCKNGPRTIDIDIIYSPDLTILTKHLAIPHAALWSRDFFLIPLSNVLDQCRWPKSLTLSKCNYMIKSAHRFLTRATH